MCELFDDHRDHQLCALVLEYVMEQWEWYTLEEQLELCQNDLDKELYLYAMESSKALCSKIYDQLPREIRDLVYDYLLGCFRIRVHGNVFYSECCCREGITPPYFHSQPASKLDRIADSHYWCVDIVGKGMQRELAEIWYRNGVFELGHQTSLLQRFLTEDRWGLGLSPSKLIKFVEVTTQIPSFIEPDGIIYEHVPDWFIDRLLDIRPRIAIRAYFFYFTETGWQEWLQHIGFNGTTLELFAAAMEGLELERDPIIRLTQSSNPVCVVVPDWQKPFWLDTLGSPMSEVRFKEQAVASLTSGLLVLD